MFKLGMISGHMDLIVSCLFTNQNIGHILVKQKLNIRQTMEVSLSQSEIRNWKSNKKRIGKMSQGVTESGQVHSRCLLTTVKIASY